MMCVNPLLRVWWLSTELNPVREVRRDLTGLFLAPATGRKGALEHLRKTVLKGVPREMYSNFIDENLGSCAHVWGLTFSIKST